MKKGAVFWAYFVVFLANAAPFYAFDFYGYIFYGNWTEAEGVNITAKVYDSSGNPSIKISEHSSATDAEGWFNISGIPGPEPDYTYKAVLAAPWLFHISEEDYPAVSLNLLQEAQCLCTIHVTPLDLAGLRDPYEVSIGFGSQPRDTLSE